MRWDKHEFLVILLYELIWNRLAQYYCLYNRQVHFFKKIFCYRSARWRPKPLLAAGLLFVSHTESGVISLGLIWPSTRSSSGNILDFTRDLTGWIDPVYLASIVLVLLWIQQLIQIFLVLWEWFPILYEQEMQRGRQPPFKLTPSLHISTPIPEFHYDDDGTRAFKIYLLT